MGMYGKNRLGQCFVADDERIGDAVALFLVGFMSSVTLLYCVLVPCAILVRISLDRNAFAHLRHYLRMKRPEFQSEFDRHLKTLVICSMLYPLSCLLSIVGTLVFLYHMYFFSTPDTSLFIFSMLTRSSTGIFNLVAFALDPTIRRAFRTSWVFAAPPAAKPNPPPSRPPSLPLDHHRQGSMDSAINDQALQSYLKAI